MSEKQQATDTGRRNFLKLAAAAAPAAAVTAVSGKPAEAAAPEAGGSGLRKTEHVKKYLDSARF